MNKPDVIPFEQDELTDFDRKLIGGRAVRLEIPLSNRYTLRKIPDMLRGFAALIDSHTRNPDIGERTVLLAIKAEVRSFNARVREIHGIDKFNKNGTTQE